jgi:hypothetical protein
MGGTQTSLPRVETTCLLQLVEEVVLTSLGDVSAGFNGPIEPSYVGAIHVHLEGRRDSDSLVASLRHLHAPEGHRVSGGRQTVETHHDGVWALQGPPKLVQVRIVAELPSAAAMDEDVLWNKLAVLQRPPAKAILPEEGQPVVRLGEPRLPAIELPTCMHQVPVLLTPATPIVCEPLLVRSLDLDQHRVDALTIGGDPAEVRPSRREFGKLGLTNNRTWVGAMAAFDVHRAESRQQTRVVLQESLQVGLNLSGRTLQQASPCQREESLVLIPGCDIRRQPLSLLSETRQAHRVGHRETPS